MKRRFIWWCEGGGNVEGFAGVEGDFGSVDVVEGRAEEEGEEEGVRAGGEEGGLHDCYC